MTLLLILLQLAGLSNVARTNQLTREANQAFAQGRYAVAAKSYSDMVTKYGVDDEAVLTNLAHSYFKAGDVVNASRYYTQLASKSDDASVRSLANSQLGVIAARQNNYAEAGVRFKEALRQDPNNTLARLNYERLMRSRPNLQPPPPPKSKEEQKKKEEEKKKQEQQKQDQQQGGTNSQPNQDQQQQQKSQQQEDQRRQDEQGKQGPQNQVGKENQDRKNERNRKGQHDPNEKEPEQDPTKAGKEKNPEKPQEDENGQEGTREQLKRMQLSEEKSRQILDAMRASEIQYLQQKRFRRRDADKSLNDW